MRALQKPKGIFWLAEKVCANEARPSTRTFVEGEPILTDGLKVADLFAGPRSTDGRRGLAQAQKHGRIGAWLLIKAAMASLAKACWRACCCHVQICL